MKKAKTFCSFSEVTKIFHKSTKVFRILRNHEATIWISFMYSQNDNENVLLKELEIFVMKSQGME